MLGEEADARAARARWKRQRSERSVAARASLKMLYAAEAHAWKVAMAAESGLTTANPGTAEIEATKEDGEEERCGADKAVVEDEGTGGGEGDGWVEAAEVEDTTGSRVVLELATAPLTPWARPGEHSSEAEALGKEAVVEVCEAYPQERLSGHVVLVEEAESAKIRASRHGSGERDASLNELKFSPVTIVEEPGGKSAGVSAALSNWAGETGGDGPDCPSPNDPPIKFSHVNIVEERSGASSGVSTVFGTDVGRHGDATDPIRRLLGVRRTHEPGGDSSGVSQSIASSEMKHAADTVPTAARNRMPRLRDAAGEERDDRHGARSSQTTIHGPSNTCTGDAPAAGEVALEEEGIGSRAEGPVQHPQSSRRLLSGNVPVNRDTMVRARGGRGAEQLEAAVNDYARDGSLNTEVRCCRSVGGGAASVVRLGGSNMRFARSTGPCEFPSIQIFLVRGC